MIQPFCCLLAALLLLKACFLFGNEPYDPIALYLTWQRSPESTMTVQWITPSERTSNRIEYRKKDGSAWEGIMGSQEHMPEQLPYIIHKVEIAGLEPDTVYEFRTGSDGKIYLFRTMPKKIDNTLKFVAGGDIYHSNPAILKKTNLAAAARGPRFAVIGGDLAYPKKASGNRRWLDWLRAWKEQMVTPEGYLIPLIPAIGNHDTEKTTASSGSYSVPESTGFWKTLSKFTPISLIAGNQRKAPFYDALFAFPGKQGYNALDFSNYLSLIILDSGHMHPIPGEQAAWLAEALKKRKKIPHTFAFYHVASYPSVRSFDTPAAREIRTHWHPIFDEFNLKLAFEHHDHAYKRTHKIKEGKRSEQGTVFIGDGAWGVDPVRQPRKPETTWYLAKSASKRHFLEVTLSQQGEARILAIGDDGSIFDEMKIFPTFN